MTNIFTYGTLMFPEVMFTVSKSKYESTKATLQGYSRHQVKARIYPGIVPRPGATVSGVLYFALSQSDVKLLHEFQDDEYVPTEVTVRTDKGPIKALAYLYGDPNNLQEKEWDVDHFVKTQLHTFAQSHGSKQKRT